MSDTHPQKSLGEGLKVKKWDGPVWIGEKTVLEERSNHRFIGNFRLEMTPGGPPCNSQLKAASLRRLHHVAKGVFKSGAENLKGGNIAQPLGSLHHSELSP